MPFIQQSRRFLLPETPTDFAQCHASTLVVLPEHNSVLVAFFAGTKEGSGDTAIWLARSQHNEWHPAQRIMAEPGVAHWNPVLHYQQGTVWLFYKVGPDVHTWTTRVAVSQDGGQSWSEPRSLINGDTQPRGPVKNKILVMSNGEWLAPGSTENDQHWDAFVDVSADCGQSWHKVDIPFVHQLPEQTADENTWQGLQDNALWECDLKQVFAWDGVIQPTLWESHPGKIHALLRSTRGKVYRTDSVDYGRSWCAAYATSLPNNNSGIDAVKLSCGTLVLACNPIAGNWGRRYPIALLESQDNGATWSQPWALEHSKGEFSYPAIIAEGAVLHLTWTFNRTNIVYQTITHNN
ncbi:hypothetical protein EHN07_08710 [Buttiauxella warmboldiae]|uniref:Sialidase domain-containing protein n=1 Tax=Buttiauxella warmboldiae TaxID=82993 RepID=A0A3N5DIL2_9ENTR|nr:exo-alpha-sialidase [Buttiauxella warmboldiae]RPH28535.1 hypothetical protein EHN07_08710 [Buttiauxella warmboldiae]